MRKFAALLVILGLVATYLFWPESKFKPPASAPRIGVITGRVSRHGYPVVARIEVKKIRELVGTGCAGREQNHLLRELGRALVSSGDPLASAESDENGRFRIEGLHPAVYDVTARTADGLTNHWAFSVRRPGQVLRSMLDLRATGLNLLGRLRWSDGHPFVGEVWIARRGTRTSPDGRFALTNLPSHAEPVFARIPGEISLVVGRFDPEREGRMDLVVDHGLVQRDGRVESAEDGRPLEGIVIRATWAESRRWCRSATRSGPDGTFRILCHPDADLLAGGDEHLTARAGVAHPAVPMSFRLRRRPLVAGRVVTVDGLPAPGAEVWLLGLPSNGGEGLSRQWRAPVLADAEGRFRFPSPVAGFAMVLVLGGGWISRDLPPDPPDGYNSLAVRLPAGEQIDLELTAIPSASVSGRVTDHEGRPVAGIRVDAWQGPIYSLAHRRIGDVFDEGFFAVTGSNGRYRIPTLPPFRSFRLRVRPQCGYGVFSKPIRPEGEANIDLSLLAPFERWVEAEVLSVANDGPVPAASIWMEPVAEEGSEWARWRGGGGLTRADGRALLGPFPAGPLVARVSHPAYVHREDLPVAPEAPRRWSVRLESGQSLAGLVRFHDGTPAAGAYVNVYKDKDLVFHQRADAAGAFGRRDLAPGRYRIWAYQAAPDGSVPQVHTLVQAGREDLVVTLVPVAPGPEKPHDDPRASPQRIVSVTGRVLDDADRPIRGARVLLRPKSAPTAGPGGRTVTWTDADGRFALDCAEGETQVLRVVGPPHLFLRSGVEAAAGDETLEIRLAPAAQPVLTVIDEAGVPVPDASVLLSEPDRPRLGHLTDPQGQMRFGGLDPERAYGLRVDPPADREDLLRVNIRDWRPADRTIRLERTWTLRGVVRDREGYPVGHASFWFSTAGSVEPAWKQVEVGGDGRFEVGRLPFTDIDTRVGVPKLPADAEGLAPRRVQAGTDPVEIEIDGGIWIGLRVPDWPPDESGRVSLAWQGGVRRLAMPASGRIRFHGLPAKKDFSLHVGPLADGRMAFGDDLLPGVDREIPLRAGASISGRILGPEDVELFHMSIYGKGIALRFDLDEDTPNDRYRVAGLPEGSYLFTILARVDDRYYDGEVEVRTGEPTDLRLEPDED